ncbi:MAG: hypothetical protein Q8M02_07945 [Candidatus Didemnitutus sp.]|nr:hypothetical protein [Candidatus Didemnitutus sp.]
MATAAQFVPISYRIDAADRIVWVNGEWAHFAQANDGGSVLPEIILGMKWEQAVSDPSVRQLYREILKRVRGGAAVSFDYRCDAPNRRRTFAMTVRPVAEGAVEFESLLIREEERPTVVLLEKGCARNDNLVIVCSWCQQVKVAATLWLPVEEAVAQLRLFEDEAMPRLSHGICVPCRDKMMAELESN